MKISSVTFRTNTETSAVVHFKSVLQTQSTSKTLSTSNHSVDIFTNA
jgi:hypothetical protein